MKMVFFLRQVEWTGRGREEEHGEREGKKVHV